MVMLSFSFHFLIRENIHVVGSIISEGAQGEPHSTPAPICPAPSPKEGVTFVCCDVSFQIFFMHYIDIDTYFDIRGVQHTQFCVFVFFLDTAELILNVGKFE